MVLLQWLWLCFQCAAGLRRPVSSSLFSLDSHQHTHTVKLISAAHKPFSNHSSFSVYVRWQQTRLLMAVEVCPAEGFCFCCWWQRAADIFTMTKLDAPGHIFSGQDKSWINVIQTQSALYYRHLLRDRVLVNIKVILMFQIQSNNISVYCYRTQTLSKNCKHIYMYLYIVSVRLYSHSCASHVKRITHRISLECSTKLIVHLFFPAWSNICLYLNQIINLSNILQAKCKNSLIKTAICQPKELLNNPYHLIQRWVLCVSASTQTWHDINTFWRILCFQLCGVGVCLVKKDWQWARNIDNVVCLFSVSSELSSALSRILSL